ncbi:MAG: DUF4430 domain-containing protein [Patescibacteria group bacterium]|nr:DUF4430 domain-containing protein [Patescibacteria group bacterium]
MKKINIFIGIGIGLIIFVSGWTIFSNKISQPLFKEEIEISQTIIPEKVILIIDDSESPQKTFRSNFRKGITAFDLLKEGAAKLNLPLKTKTYDIGIFIEAIGDRENGQDGKYWLYYVNGVLPMVAADKMELKIGDKVEFKFEKSPF